jgi:hypothetical protein
MTKLSVARRLEDLTVDMIFTQPCAVPPSESPAALSTGDVVLGDPSFLKHHWQISAATPTVPRLVVEGAGCYYLRNVERAKSTLLTLTSYLIPSTSEECRLAFLCSQ